MIFARMRRQYDLSFNFLARPLNRTAVTYPSHIRMPQVLDYIMPAREINRIRRQPSPTVAWHALDDESAFPFAIIIFLLLALLAVQLSRYTPLLLSSIHIPAWCKDPLGLRRQAARIAQLHERHRAASDKFAKVVYRFRGLQVQLKERDDRLLRQARELDATAETLDELHAAIAQLRDDNRRLVAANERLHADRVAAEGHAREQAYECARLQREREGLERVVGLLEADKAAAKDNYEQLDQAHEGLRLQLMDLEEALAQQRETSVHAEAALEEAVKCNEHLLQQLHEHQAEQGRQSEQRFAVAEEQYEAALEQARRDNEVLREQLTRQHELHSARQEEILQKLEAAQAERREMKAKLKKARADIRVKASDITRLEQQAEQYQHRYEEQRDSFHEDLTFVHTESQCERDMFEGQLTSAQAESSTLRNELAERVRRYEQQAARLSAAQASLRDASSSHTQLELKLKAAAAEKQVADNLEHLLHSALRREQDRYETLEISFDVLESAYAFLARELVRTEHALEDALQAQQQLRESTQTPEHVKSIVKTYDRACVSPSDTEPSSDDGRSWPATPALTRSYHSTTTSISSPIVATPPLPALCLEPIPSVDSRPSKDLASPSDPNNIFGPWSPLISPT